MRGRRVTNAETDRSPSWVRRAMVAGLIIVVLGAGVVAWAALRSSGGSTEPGPEGVIVRNVPDLASRSSTLLGHKVDGITCRPIDHAPVRYHVHVYVSVFVDGHEERLPAGIGITAPYIIEHLPAGPFYDGRLGDCLYWLHTHAYDGIVHVEAPKKQTFTLGQFFDVWNQQLSSSQVGPARGTVVVFENGRRLAGSPRSALLIDHAVIQIDVGTPVVPFHPFTFRVSGSCGQGTLSCKPKGSRPPR
jgi:hypothetical protein